jgi:precorrin-6B methylase 2
VFRAPEAGLSRRVQVRRRGALVELRIDGTLSSAHRPGGGAAGPIWETLGGLILALPPERRRRVLMLGLGGGSAPRVARRYAPDARIVGIERDPDVARAALEHFGLGELGVEVVVDDALAFLKRNRERYDLVLEDIFIGPNATVRKPEWLPEPGLGLALGHLEDGGLLGSNTIHEEHETARALAGRGTGVVSIAIEGYYNHVVVAGPPSLTTTGLRRVFAAESRLARTLPKLSFRTAARPTPR